MDRSRIEAFRVLGIPSDSDQDAVGHAFRRLALTTHPDVSADPDAAGRFADLAAAYRLASAALEAAPASASLDSSGLRHESRAPGGEPDRDGLPRGWPVPSGPTLIPLRHRRAPSVAAPIVAGPVRVSPIHSSPARTVSDG